MKGNTMNLYCSESYVHVVGEKRFNLGTFGEPYETSFDNTGDLYRACVKEHGRCISKQYIENSTGRDYQIGWVFLKRNPEGEGCIEAWVTCMKTPPKRQVEYVGAEYPTFKK